MHELRERAGETALVRLGVQEADLDVLFQLAVFNDNIVKHLGNGTHGRNHDSHFPAFPDIDIGIQFAVGHILGKAAKPAEHADDARHDE